MKLNNPWLVALAVIVGLQAVVIVNMLHRQKLASQAAPLAKAAPAKLEPIPNSKLQRVTLTPKAAERLGVKTQALEAARPKVASNVPTAAVPQRSVPYASLLYDRDGTTWVYKEVAPLSYERHQVQVASIVGDDVFITDGPPPGTAVVVQGAIEVFGTETKVGH